MTLRELHERIGSILSERPEYAGLPVEVQSRKTGSKRSPSTYEPIMFVSGCPLGFADGSKIITLIGDIHGRHGAIPQGEI